MTIDVEILGNFHFQFAKGFDPVRGCFEPLSPTNTSL